MLDEFFLTDRASLMQQQIFQYAALLPRQSKGLTVHSSNAVSYTHLDVYKRQATVSFP